MKLQDTLQLAIDVHPRVVEARKYIDAHLREPGTRRLVLEVWKLACTKDRVDAWKDLNTVAGMMHTLMTAESEAISDHLSAKGV